MRLFVYWFGAALGAYAVIVLPVVILLNLSAIPSFFFGMLVGGFAPVVGLFVPRIERWVMR